jgi:hypothetical protein
MKSAQYANCSRESLLLGESLSTCLDQDSGALGAAWVTRAGALRASPFDFVQGQALHSARKTDLFTMTPDQDSEVLGSAVLELNCATTAPLLLNEGGNAAHPALGPGGPLYRGLRLRPRSELRCPQLLLIVGQETFRYERFIRCRSGGGW